MQNFVQKLYKVLYFRLIVVLNDFSYRKSFSKLSQSKGIKSKTMIKPLPFLRKSIPIYNTMTKIKKVVLSLGIYFKRQREACCIKLQIFENRFLKIIQKRACKFFLHNSETNWRFF